MLPASQILLTINNIAITHHLLSKIRHLWSQMSQRTYLTKHHEWGPESFDLINWELFCQNLLDNTFNKQFFFIKWTNLILPLNNQYHSFNIYLSPKCTSNYSHDKTEYQFLHCINPERQQLNNNY